MSKLKELTRVGQSIWYDYIRRAVITSGELQELIDRGLRGVTSNPSIFEKAIAGSADYDADLKELSAENRSLKELYEALALKDIALTADLMRPVYDATDARDGFVSLEVSPELAKDTEGTITEAKRLFETLGRPNVMIKVPATPEGLPAITELIAAGINVNVTLIFSVENYRQVAEAFLRGMESLANTGPTVAGGVPVEKIGSVASFFVSRVDTAVDAELDRIGNDTLKGKIAIANAKIAYAEFRRIFSGERWQQLADRGARVQRPLWASTGVKNPLYPDTLYVDQLIGPDTVNTVPPATLNRFLEHGVVAETLTAGLAEAQAQLQALSDLGIDLQQITQKLQDDGVAAFAKAFQSLMNSIAEKRDHLRTGEKRFSAELGSYHSAVDKALEELRDEHIMSRLWAHDYTVWKDDPTEISNRLGWLHSPELMIEALDSLSAFVDEVRRQGYTHALLMGMGGSSLAPEVFRHTFGVLPGFLDLAVLDSTDPGAVAEHLAQLDPAKTLYIVATKSGGTVETMSFMKTFYNRTMETVGAANAGEHFIAITDPGSGLEELAKKLNFRKTFLNDPDIGGRYSALSYFGLVPAALVGVDLAKLLDRAATMACNCEGCNCPVAGDNSGAWLGAIMAVLAKAGRDKLTLVSSPAIAAFGAWAEQLIAESTGKEGKGILPVDGEALLEPDAYAEDRLFVHLQLEGDDRYDAALQKLAAAGHPVVHLRLEDLYDLGGEFFRWEVATAVAGSILNINPFDQPNVESAKVLAKKMVAEYRETGKLPELTPTMQTADINAYADFTAGDIPTLLRKFLSQLKAEPPRGYVALQAYLKPDTETDVALQALRTAIQRTYRVATTVGYGPRFLHSTGQLHKGDAGKGLFIQFTADNAQDLPIPDNPGSDRSSITFGVLKAAQALGDRQALLDGGRQVLRLHFHVHPAEGIQKIVKALV